MINPINDKRKDHAQLICDISELAELFKDTTSLENFLQKIVEMIAAHMHSEVCSVYLYNEKNQELVMRANKGLNPDSIGKIKLKLGEGLTGWALKELRPICERHASKNSNFRFFSDLGEEKFESFLAVPIIRGTTRIGALVIQNTAKDYFRDEDIITLRAISSQLANTIEMTRMILSVEEKPDRQQAVVSKSHLKFIRGIIGSRGVAVGEAFVISDEKLILSAAQVNNKEYSIKDFQQAVSVTEKELETLQNEIEAALSDVASLIFTAQLLMLKDQVFLESITALIQKGANPPQAITDVVEEYVRKFSGLSDEYLREKAQDVRDIGQRLLENLMGEERFSKTLGNSIVIARQLFPSDILKLSSQKVRGIILLTGGATAHFSILAQSLHIPLIIADHSELLLTPQKTKILLDAEQGNIYIDPSEEILEPFRRKEIRIHSEKVKVKPETFTHDGTKVSLMANINLLSDLREACDCQAEGVGLYRTEFPFIVRNNFPTEEEQLVVYKKLVEGMKGKEITFRTLDIGGDKVLSYFDHHHKEKNPYLGMRSIRFSLKHVDIFLQQIRAILRASIGAKVRIMFPMISSLDDYLQAKAILENCIKALKEEKVAHHDHPQIGLMVELPSVLEVIDELAEEADFFSIGTNDFIQYMLAVDRTNEKVSDLYLPHHPAILRSLKRVVDSAVKHNIDVSICGDMAQEEKYLPYFLGIGVRKFSINPGRLPQLQAAIALVDLKKAQETTKNILSKSRLQDIQSILGE